MGTKGNGNALKHGLTTGRLPPKCAYIRRTVQGMLHAMHAELERRGGEISLYESALCQSAVRWERHALLAQRWLRIGAENMTAADRLAYSREIARASSERDKCLRALNLDTQGIRDLAASSLYGPKNRLDNTPGEPG